MGRRVPVTRVVPRRDNITTVKVVHVGVVTPSVAPRVALLHRLLRPNDTDTGGDERLPHKRAPRLPLLDAVGLAPTRRLRLFRPAVHEVVG